MKIQVEIEVFDDPEYCDDNNTGGCIFIGESNTASSFYFCNIFKDRLKENKFFNWYIKCDQCKTAYQEAIIKDVEMVKKTLLKLADRKPNYIEEK